MITELILLIVLVLVIHNAILYNRIYKRPRHKSNRYSTTMPASEGQLQLIQDELRELELESGALANELKIDRATALSLTKGELKMTRAVAHKFIKKLKEIN